MDWTVSRTQKSPDYLNQVEDFYESKHEDNKNKTGATATFLADGFCF